MNCAILGAGYVGTPLAAILAFYNPETKFFVLDINESLIIRWKTGNYPFHENNLSKYIESTLGKNLFFTTNGSEIYQECDKYFICVNTSTKNKGKGKNYATDMSSVLNCINEIIEYYDKLDSINSQIIIVEKSTVPFKTGDIIDKLIKKKLNDSQKHKWFNVLSNPEFVAEGFLMREYC